MRVARGAAHHRGMRLLHILVRAVAVWLPGALIPVRPADIGGSALAVLASLLVALVWGWYDGRHPSGANVWVRWTWVAGLLGAAAAVKDVVVNGPSPAPLVAFALIGCIVLAPAAVGLAVGGSARDRRARRAHS